MRTSRGMKIATFNINNVKRRLPNLLDWLKTADPPREHGSGAFRFKLGADSCFAR
jgi:hypothetical protein